MKREIKINYDDVIREMKREIVNNDDITISCDGKERKGMSTMAMAMSQYIEKKGEEK